MKGAIYTNKEKLNNYNLTGSIHTLSIKSPGIINKIDENIADCIKTTAEVKQNKTNTKSIINPNKLLGDALTFSDFKTSFDTILAGAGIDYYNIIRADMRFDNYDKSHYYKFTKLNKYLISMLAVTYNVKNVYETKNLFTQKQLSIAIKNDYFEIENYDRNKKNEITKNTTEPAKARLEERSIARQWRIVNKNAKIEPNWNMDALKKEFTDGWFKRWNEAMGNLNLVQKVYNDNLEKVYNQDKNAFPRQFRTITDFVMQHQDCIFTRKQLIDLFSRFGVQNPTNRAKNYKQKYGIEFFSKADVEHAVYEIKRATTAFFNQ